MYYPPSTVQYLALCLTEDFAKGEGDDNRRPLERENSALGVQRRGRRALNSADDPEE